MHQNHKACSFNAQIVGDDSDGGTCGNITYTTRGENRSSSYLIQAASKCQAATIELQGQADILN